MTGVAEFPCCGSAYQRRRAATLGSWAISAAIADHLAPDGGGFVTAFHLAVEYVDADGNQCHVRVYPAEQRATVTMGLLQWEIGVARYEQQRHACGNLVHEFGTIVADYFGHIPYQVGSSITSKDWRDVDVRLILPDDEFAAMFGEIQSAEVNVKLAAVSLAFAALGQAMTGLPIDFQIQPQTHANEKHPGRRNALIEYRPADV
ncbi:hypothetical protein [Cryptosporangium aurantiacum]|uniref:Uncharacterized protein n=1 Tax=Cryptosporangium aurantiacum TaxID=134849 RepID=A0A1M7PTC6_9ACTN|nr:hypothetical protein [Cryptosporangium aurantiacum]SHN20580.1 hypothetical protein SAMN05443668_103653 [Cryptosporangium aurantiacum]